MTALIGTGHSIDQKNAEMKGRFRPRADLHDSPAITVRVSLLDDKRITDSVKTCLNVICWCRTLIALKRQTHRKVGTQSFRSKGVRPKTAGLPVQIWTCRGSMYFDSGHIVQARRYFRHLSFPLTGICRGAQLLSDAAR